MSCGAIVVTTDAPPMNELVSDDRGVLVPYCNQEPRHLGTNFFVDPDLLEEKIVEILSQDSESKSQKGARAREWFEQNHQQFINNITTTLSDIL